MRRTAFDRHTRKCSEQVAGKQKHERAQFTKRPSHLRLWDDTFSFLAASCSPVMARFTVNSSSVGKCASTCW